MVNSSKLILLNQLEVGCLYTAPGDRNAESWKYLPEKGKHGEDDEYPSMSDYCLSSDLWIPNGQAFMFLGLFENATDWSPAIKLLYKDAVLYINARGCFYEVDKS